MSRKPAATQSRKTVPWALMADNRHRLSLHVDDDREHKEAEMINASRSTTVALAFNISVLVPIVSALMLGVPQTEQSFGPMTEGRSILISVYIAIAVVSAALIAMHLKRLAWAMPMSVALFAVQITYKLITVPMVGLSNPVVISNLVVVAVQVLALSILWKAHQRSAS